MALPGGGFFTAGGFLFAVGKVFDPELGSCLDAVVVVPVAGLVDAGVVVGLTALVGSTFAFVAGVVGLTAGGLVAVVGAFVGVVFFGSGF